MLLLPSSYTDYPTYFSDALNFLRDYSWLYNFPVTDLLVCKVLERIPKDWVTALLYLSNEELNKLPQGSVKDDWPESLVTFFNRCHKLKIPVRIAIKQEDELPDKIRKGLTPKKQHEVSSLGAFLNSECNSLGIRNVLDVGSGLGYLDRLLHYQYGYSVIGLESQPERVKTAHEHQLNLCPTSAVTHIICDISSESKPLVESALQNKSTCIVGLHACGDLAVNAIKLFMQIDQLKLMVLLPCCYHKMALIAENEFVNFPLSLLLRDMINSKKYCDCKDLLSRPFLRLASQETASRWENMSEEEHCQHSENLMARAILQLCAHREGVTLKKKHRRAVRKTNRSSFDSFMEDALSRYEFQAKESFDISSFRNELIEFWDKYEASCKLAEIITGIQLAIQTVAESFVMADRAAYLYENDVTSVEIVQVMNDTLSPRCCALVAKK